MKISLIICTYNREDYILKALESVTRQTLNRSNFECVIINNNSTDSTGEICKDFIENNSDISFIYAVEMNQGLSHARNRGIKESTGDIVVFIDDDAIAEPDFLEVGYNYFREHPDVSCIGGKILLHFIGEKPKWHNRFLSSLFGYFNLGNNVKPFKKYYPRGSNMFFKKTLFNKYGYFNVELGRKGNNLAGAEEKDIYLRMKGKESIVYVPSAIVHHIVPEGRTTMDFIKKQGLGTGTSERIRLVSNPSAYRKRQFSELKKWCASLAISFFYFCTLQFAKANIILKFRYWTTKGLLTKIEKKS